MYNLFLSIVTMILFIPPVASISICEKLPKRPDSQVPDHNPSLGLISRSPLS